MVDGNKYLLVNPDGIILVSSGAEARAKAKGKALVYSLHLAITIGYNKAEKVAKVEEEKPEQPRRGRPAKS
jgi:hypothetical protein